MWTHETAGADKNAVRPLTGEGRERELAAV